jgi:hypothetical protein
MLNFSFHFAVKRLSFGCIRLPLTLKFCAQTMEFLYLSPEFPPNYANFIVKLDEMNVNVWGIGEADFYFMPEKLRSALKWYVRVNLTSIAEVEKALDQLLSVKAALGAPPHFDRVESHNEQWLQLEGFINYKLGIDGIQPNDLNRLKKKSVMKKLFKESGLPVARGERITDFNHGLRLADDLGYPLILKPDEGVGAIGIHKVIDEAQLRHLLSEIDGDHLIEEFIDAKIVTYDGLVDGNGRILFENSFIYGEGVLEYVLGKDTFFSSAATSPTNCRRSAGGSRSCLTFAESSFILSSLWLVAIICPSKSTAGRRAARSWI